MQVQNRSFTVALPRFSSVLEQVDGAFDAARQQEDAAVQQEQQARQVRNEQRIPVLLSEPVATVNVAKEGGEQSQSTLTGLQFLALLDQMETKQWPKASLVSSRNWIGDESKWSPNVKPAVTQGVLAAVKKLFTGQIAVFKQNRTPITVELFEQYTGGSMKYALLSELRELGLIRSRVVKPTCEDEDNFGQYLLTSKARQLVAERRNQAG